MSTVVEQNIQKNRDQHRFRTTPEALDRQRVVVEAWRRFLAEPRTDGEWNRFLANVSVTDRAAVGLFSPEFRAGLDGATVLELGCGRGNVSAAMAMMGADVTAVDISPRTPDLVEFLCHEFGLSDRLKVHSGDLRDIDLPEGSFDRLVGLNILHHLVHELEGEIIERCALLLKTDGEARFVEPAENSRLIEWLIELLPFRGKPSSLQKEAYARWKARDSHPPRDNTTAHYRSSGEAFFHEVDVRPYGGLERFASLVPGSGRLQAVRSSALRAEGWLPSAVGTKIAASQVILYRRPKRAALPQTPS